MRQKQDMPKEEMQGIPVAPSNNTDNIHRMNKIGVIITATALGLIAIALVTMFVLTV